MSIPKLNMFWTTMKTTSEIRPPYKTTTKQQISPDNDVGHATFQNIMANMFNK
jgi:hypothetical protein